MSTAALRGLTWSLALLICTLPGARAADWVEARVDDFVLVTDAKEAYARTALRDFAVFKQALGVLAPLTRAVPRMPTQMFAFDAGTWRSFAPSAQVAGYFAPRSHANYIVYDRTPKGMLAREVVFHEYMHYVLYNGSAVILPAWWDEGVAEVFSSLAEHDGKIDFGLPPRARKADFAYFDLMPTAVLFAVDRNSPAYRRHDIAPMFYAQSWLTAHYFLIARPDRGKQVQRYLQETSAGVAMPEAVQTAFGVSVDELDEEIRAYRRKGKVIGYRLTLDKALPDAKDIVIRPLPEPVALARIALAGLMLGKDVSDAEKRAQRALQLDPALLLAQAALADVRFQQKRDAEAIELSRKAMGAAASNPEAMSAAGRVQWQIVARSLQPKQAAPGDDATVEELIDESLSADDDRAEPAADQVALLRAARAQLLPFTADSDHGLEATITVTYIDSLLRDRKLEDTLELVESAATLYPTHPELAEAQALLYLALGRHTAALTSASRAARYARSPAARRWLESWVAELEAAADASR